MKKNKSYKITERTKQRIEKLSNAHSSVDEFFEAACEAYEKESKDFSYKVKNLKSELVDIVQELEKIRDYQPENFTAQMAETHKNLMEVWEILRLNPLIIK